LFRRCTPLLLLFFSFSDSFAQRQRFSFTESKMGSSFTIILYADDSVQACASALMAYQLVDSLVNSFSDYADSSELNRLCARAGTDAVPFACSAPLFDILSQSKYAYQQSGGRFDITLGPVTRLWRTARKENIFPDSAIVQEKLSSTGLDKLVLDSLHQTARLTQAGMQLDLGGIGQGYIAQKVIDFLSQQQIKNALVDVSGDIVCIGAPPGKTGWTVAVNVPESKTDLLPQQLLITNRAVTTSGDVYQYMLHNGRRYSHIVDPHTGYGITSQRNVTVVAANGTLADWLTKACSLLPVAAAKKLAKRLDASLLIAELKNGRIIYHRTKNFAAWWKPVPGRSTQQ
jgi:FAD:protein FMN transferase